MNGETTSKNTSGIVVAVIITAIVVGGGVYWWQQSTIENSNSNQTVNTNTETNINTVVNTNSVSNVNSGEAIEYADLNRVTVKHRHYNYPKGHYLEIKTEENYPDSCYFLRCNEEISGDQITVTLQDKVYKQTGSICTMMPEPADCRIKLELDDGTYTIEINETDTYDLEVSGDNYTLEEDSTSFSSLE